MHDPLIQTLSLLALLQRERGYALRALPLGASEAVAAFEMQSTLTSLAYEELEKNLASLDILMPRRFFDAMNLRNNEAFRQSQPLEVLAEWYAFNLEEPVRYIVHAQIMENPNLSPAQASALGHNLASITALSRVRDIGLSIYAKAEISTADINRMKNAASSCLARERLFLGLADENTKQILDEIRAARAMSEAEAFLSRIKAGQAKALLSETPPPVWFTNLDEEMVLRHEALRQMIERLASEGRELALLNAPGQALDGDIEAMLDLIAALPLFRGLTEGTLRGALKGARIADVEKGDAFLTQGEPVSRFFVLLEGWAKAFKTAADGEESVIQILGKKDCLLDNPFLNPGVSNLSAKTVTKAKLLSLSLSALRDAASRNRELAQNLLAVTAQRLQRLVAQFEQITLRTAEERVGWFLVNLHLETGLEGAPLQLPYDKALIANYLNIKPETFSRVLQLFRQKGFKIDKHEVVMPHPQALCAYCDPDMALRCCRAEAVDCAPIRAARRAEGR